MKEKLFTLFSYFTYGIIIIYCFYGCFHTTSPRLKEPIAFKANSRLIVLTPNNKLICAEFITGKEINSQDKIAIFEYGRYSPIHYFGGFYNIDSNNLPFGIRYYSGANEIWLLELRVLKTNLNGESFFSNNFSQFSNEVFQFDNKDNLIVQGLKFTKFELNKEELNSINQLEKNLGK
jgi:hypothetical protein